MRKEAAELLWYVLGAFLFYFLWNAVSAAHGWNLTLPGLNFKDWDPYGAALVATPIGLVCFATLMCIGALYARRSESARPIGRLPIPFKLGDPDSVVLHAAQAMALIVLPFVALISLFDKFLNGSFCHLVRLQGLAAPGHDACGNGKVPYDRSPLSLFSYVAPREAFRPNAFVYQGGNTYWPFWEPLAICVLGLIALASLAWFAFEVFKMRPQTATFPPLVADIESTG
ncbi:MAG TPA: hypothetical protein VIM02_00365 [Rhizomicrobium sp.]|jgi:hypothetical protein